jgi:uncharacterized membrane protein YfcA
MLRPEALEGTAFSPAVLAVSLVAAGCGTWLGGRVLEKLSERGFRKATRALVATLGVAYLVRGVFIAGN